MYNAMKNQNACNSCSKQMLYTGIFILTQFKTKYINYPCKPESILFII